jgi:maltose O-acetyltransferase
VLTEKDKMLAGGDAVIGAGSIVTRDVPAGATALGNPAHAVRKETLT